MGLQHQLELLGLLMRRHEDLLLAPELHLFEPQNNLKIPELNVVMYDFDNMDPIQIVDHKFDLILVDGPNGDRRSKWYSKFRKCV
ncbi:MAG: hypothetical protein EB101_05545, partial [Chitinophagia bacterium]|nr:hypothetical protein [Chitinophagia bacterium]